MGIFWFFVACFGCFVADCLGQEEELRPVDSRTTPAALAKAFRAISTARPQGLQVLALQQFELVPEDAPGFVAGLVSAALREEEGQSLDALAAAACQTAVLLEDVPLGSGETLGDYLVRHAARDVRYGTQALRCFVEDALVDVSRLALPLLRAAAVAKDAHLAALVVHGAELGAEGAEWLAPLVDTAPWAALVREAALRQGGPTFVPLRMVPGAELSEFRFHAARRLSFLGWLEAWGNAGAREDDSAELAADEVQSDANVPLRPTDEEDARERVIAREDKSRTTGQVRLFNFANGLARNYYVRHEADDAEILVNKFENEGAEPDARFQPLVRTVDLQRLLNARVTLLLAIATKHYIPQPSDLVLSSQPPAPTLFSTPPQPPRSIAALLSSPLPSPPNSTILHHLAMQGNVRGIRLALRYNPSLALQKDALHRLPRHLAQQRGWRRTAALLRAVEQRVGGIEEGEKGEKEVDWEEMEKREWAEREGVQWESVFPGIGGDGGGGEGGEGGGEDGGDEVEVGGEGWWERSERDVGMPVLHVVHEVLEDLKPSGSEVHIEDGPRDGGWDGIEGCDVPVYTASSLPSLGTFLSRHVFGEQPALFRGFANTWPMHSLWRAHTVAESLSKIIGTVRAAPDDTQDTSHPTPVSLAEFVATFLGVRASPQGFPLTFSSSISPLSSPEAHAQLLSSIHFPSHPFPTNPISTSTTTQNTSQVTADAGDGSENWGSLSSGGSLEFELEAGGAGSGKAIGVGWEEAVTVAFGRRLWVLTSHKDSAVSREPAAEFFAEQLPRILKDAGNDAKLCVQEPNDLLYIPAPSGRASIALQPAATLAIKL